MPYVKRISQLTFNEEYSSYQFFPLLFTFCFFFSAKDNHRYTGCTWCIAEISRENDIYQNFDNAQKITQPWSLNPFWKTCSIQLWYNTIKFSRIMLTKKEQNLWLGLTENQSKTVFIITIGHWSSWIQSFSSSPTENIIKKAIKSSANHMHRLVFHKHDSDKIR